MIRIIGFTLLLPAIALVTLSLLYTMLLVLIVIGLGNIYSMFLGDKDEEASSQK